MIITPEARFRRGFKISSPLAFAAYDTYVNLYRYFGHTRPYRVQVRARQDSD
jgi:hypothetical protein